MAGTVKLKRSAVQGKVPSVSDLALGEIAINTYDGKVYIKKDDGTASVIEVGAPSSDTLQDVTDNGSTTTSGATFGNTVASPSFYGNATGSAQVWYGGNTGTSIITAEGNATFDGNLTLGGNLTLNDSTFDLYSQTTNSTSKTFQLFSDIGGTKNERAFIYADGSATFNSGTFASGYSGIDSSGTVFATRSTGSSDVFTGGVNGQTSSSVIKANGSAYFDDFVRSGDSSTYTQISDTDGLYVINSNVTKAHIDLDGFAEFKGYVNCTRFGSTASLGSNVDGVDYPFSIYDSDNLYASITEDGYATFKSFVKSESTSGTFSSLAPGYIVVQQPSGSSSDLLFRGRSAVGSEVLELWADGSADFAGVGTFSDDLRVQDGGNFRVRIASDASQDAILLQNNGNITASGKITSASTEASDSGTTVVTKDFLSSTGSQFTRSGTTISTTVAGDDLSIGGAIGIGTSSPRGNLHLDSSSSTRIDLTNTATGTASGDGSTISIDGTTGALNIIQRESQSIQFYTGGNEQVRIDSSGDMEIGSGNYLNWVASPGGAHRGRIKCDSGDSIVFENTSGNSERMRIDGSSGSVFIGGNDAATADIALNQDGSAVFTGTITGEQTSDNSLAVIQGKDSNGVRFSISGAGQAAFKNSSLTETITLTGGSGTAVFTDGSDYNVRIRPFNGDGANQFEVRNDTDIRAYITGGGSAGFGATPNNVNASGVQLNANNIGVAVQTNGKNFRGYDYATGNETSHINQDGQAFFKSSTKIGSATSFSNANCDDLQVGDTSETNTGITIGSSTQGQIAFADADDSRPGLIHYQHSDDSMRFFTAGAANERVRITNAGNVLIGGTTSATADIQLNADGSGIFGALTVDANLTPTSGTSVELFYGTSGGVLQAFDRDNANFEPLQVKGSTWELAYDGSATFDGDVHTHRLRSYSPDETYRLHTARTSGDAFTIWNGSTGIGNGTKITSLKADGAASFSGGNVTISDGTSGQGKVEIYRSSPASADAFVIGTSTSSPNVTIQNTGYADFENEVEVRNLNANYQKGRSGALFQGYAGTAGEDAANWTSQINSDGSATFTNRLKIDGSKNPQSPNNIWLGLGSHGTPTKYYDFATVDPSNGDLLAGILQDGSATFGEVSGKNIPGTESDGDVEVWIGKTYHDVETSKIYADGKATFNGYVTAGTSSTDYGLIGQNSKYSNVWQASVTGQNFTQNGPVWAGLAYNFNATTAGVTSLIKENGDAKFDGRLELGNAHTNGYHKGLIFEPHATDGSYLQLYGQNADTNRVFSIYNGDTNTVKASISSIGNATFDGYVGAKTGAVIWRAANSTTCELQTPGTDDNTFLIRARSGVSSWGGTGTDEFYVTAAGNGVFTGTVTANGATFGASVSIGTALNPTAIQLNSGGTGVFSGNVTANGTVLTSDARFKENITPASSQLADVAALGGILKNFDWNEEAPANEELRSVRQLGLIAQEAEEICPGVVKTITRQTPEGEDDSYKGISHDALIMKMLGAISDLKAENEALLARIEALES